MNQSVPEKSTRSATLPSSSFSSRARSCREVTNFPSLPANDEVLIEKTIDTVGSSTAMRGRGFGSSASEIVSPIVTSSIPAIATMSPAVASAISVRLSPSYP